MRLHICKNRQEITHEIRSDKQPKPVLCNYGNRNDVQINCRKEHDMRNNVTCEAIKLQCIISGVSIRALVLMIGDILTCMNMVMSCIGYLLRIGTIPCREAAVRLMFFARIQFCWERLHTLSLAQYTIPYKLPKPSM